jgi:hypothetical protein
LIGLLSERKRQFTTPSLHTIRFDIRKILTIHTWSALIGAAAGIGMRQDVISLNLVVQRIETIVGFSLRFCV